MLKIALISFLFLFVPQEEAKHPRRLILGWWECEETTEIECTLNNDKTPKDTIRNFSHYGKNEDLSLMPLLSNEYLEYLNDGTLYSYINTGEYIHRGQPYVRESATWKIKKDIYTYTTFGYFYIYKHKLDYSITDTSLILYYTFDLNYLDSIPLRRTFISSYKRMHDKNVIERFRLLFQ